MRATELSVYSNGSKINGYDIEDKLNIKTSPSDESFGKQKLKKILIKKLNRFLSANYDTDDLDNFNTEDLTDIIKEFAEHLLED